MGHLIAEGLFWPSSTIPAVDWGRSDGGGAEGWADMNVLDADAAFEGRYERIVFSWSAVGVASITWRSNWRDGASFFSGGYEEDNDDRKRFRAFVEGGDEGLWLAWRWIHLSLGIRMTYKIDISGYKI